MGELDGLLPTTRGQIGTCQMHGTFHGEGCQLCAAGFPSLTTVTRGSTPVLVAVRVDDLETLLADAYPDAKVGDMDADTLAMLARVKSAVADKRELIDESTAERRGPIS